MRPSYDPGPSSVCTSMEMQTRESAIAKSTIYCRGLEHSRLPGGYIISPAYTNDTLYSRQLIIVIQ